MHPLVTACRYRRALLAGALLLAPCAVAAAAPAAKPAPATGRPPMAARSGRPKPAAPARLQSLRPTPDRLVLNGPYSEARVLFEGQLPGGAVRDVSGDAVLSVADTRVATVSPDGMVRPHGDGGTVLVARLQGREARVPLAVRGVAKAAPPRFLTDVMPVLTRSGCNQGGCHGAQSGKGGFKLSLLGYDPDSDYDAIARWGGARRVTRTRPENSLLLRKATLSSPHRGGKRFDVDSPEYRLMRDWIAGGMPAPAADEPRVTRLEVVPAVRTLAIGQTQRFLVRAHYSDGSQRDATAQTLFTAHDESVATVTPDGTAKVVSPGEGAVVIRYQGVVATARLISPFSGVQAFGHSGVQARAPERPNPPSLRGAPGTPERLNAIDRLVNEKLAALGLQASGRATDAEFVRRAYLDAIGLPPTPDEVRAFLRSRAPDKRERLIDALLDRPEYVDFWTLKWADLLRNSRRSLTDKGMYSFHRWIRQSVAENRPWDRFARDLILARGSSFDEGPANYFRIAGKPEDLAETTAQLFLGVRMQCARCHNHPYEKWTQSQYYELAGFFARVRSKGGDTPEERDIFLASSGEVRHPRTGKEVTPTALDAAPMPAEYSGDRRQVLAEWLTSAENPFFGRVIANRLWRHFMGRGLVEPVDDFRVTNPPSNPALLDWLASDLAAHGYDLKHLMREIMRSETYQRSSRPMRGSEGDTKYHSHYPFKRMGAEQLLDALTAATGVAEKFDGLPMGTRAAQLPDTAVSSYFLDVFGRPARRIACECERTAELTIAQVLHLMNNAGINEKIAAKDGRVSSLLAANLPPRRIVDELYLASLSRFPTPEESRTALAAFTAAPDRQRAAEDLLWALLNSKEFLFNH